MSKRQTSLDDERKESNELDRGNPQVLGGTVTNQYDVELLARLQLRDASINEIINKIRQRENRKRKEQLGLALAIGLLWVKAPHEKRIAKAKQANDKAKEANEKRIAEAKEANEKLIAEAKEARDKAKEANEKLIAKAIQAKDKAKEANEKRNVKAKLILLRKFGKFGWWAD